MKLEQQQELMARLSIMQKLSLAEAMEILNVSESTIRRIFAKMEKEGVAIRTHGGIQSASGAMTRYSFEYGTKTNIEKKTAIAREACKLLKNGDVIFCDTGTTTQCFCAELVCRIKREGLNVKLYTNSLANLELLSPYMPVTLIGGELPEICLDACKAAKARGLTISCDLNFRKKLWTSQRAGEVMSQLLPYVDVCIANEEDAKDVFGIEAEGTDINSGKLNRDGYISVARQLSSRFGCKYVAITLRSSISANDNDWAGMLYEAAADKAYFSTTYHVHIVDRVGGGDSFGGGLIYSMLSGYDAQQTIDFAVAASCLKHSIEHDFNHVSVAEVAALAAGNASGRVQR